MIKKTASLFCCLLLWAGSAAAVDFSADMTMTAKEVKTTGKMYYTKERSRMDFKTPEEMVMITRWDKKVVWNIMPRERMYMEIPLTMAAQEKPRVDEKFDGETERKEVGRETVDGHPTIKYLITYRSGNKQEQAYQWLATDINFPVKSASVDGSWTQEFRNIKFGSQPDSLFELPAGYQKFEIPGGMNFPVR